MAFPETDLPLQIKAAFGADPSASPGSWDFTDLTSRLIRSAPVRHTVNRRPYSSVSDGSLCSLSLNNDDGELTPLRAMSTLWPDVKRDVPCELLLQRADDTFTRTVSNGWGTSNTGHAWTTAGGVAGDYSTTGTQGSVAVSATASDRVTVVDLDGPHQQVRITATTNATPANGTIETGVVARYTDASNHYIGAARVATDGTITAYVGKKVAGTITSLATAATGLSTGTSKHILFQVIEDRIQLKIWLVGTDEPDTWHVDMFDASLTTGDWAGSYSRRNTGNTTPTTFTYDTFDTTHSVAAGFASSWLTDITPTTEMDDELCVTRLSFAGPIKRLAQGGKPLRSPLFRSLSNLTGEFVPLVYVPMEDRSGSSRFASGLPGGLPMTFTGNVDPAGDSGPIGSDSLPVFGSTGRAELPIPTYTSTGFWHAQVLVFIPESLSGSTNITLLTVRSDGPTIGYFTLWLNLAAGEFGVSRYSQAGTLLASTGTAWDAAGGSPIGNWIWVVMDCRENAFGSDDQIAVNLYDMDPAGASFGVFGENIGATGYGRATHIGLNGAVTPAPAGGEGISFGHQWLIADAQFDITGDPRDYVLPAMAHVGETGRERWTRLCEEEGQAYSIAPGDTETMGAQTMDTFLGNLALVAETDGGILGEDRFALDYIPRASRYNRPVAQTIDMSTYKTESGTSASVLAPIYDDANFRNEWTLTNVSGSSAILTDSSYTPLRYEASGQISTYQDSDLLQHTAWRLHLTTFDTHRYENTPINLAANPEMIGPWLGTRSGMTRIVRSSLPGKAPDGDIDEIVASFTQTILNKKWDVAYTGAPAKPWDVGVYGVDRYDSAYSTLATGYDADDTSLSVVTAAGHAPWVTSAAFPSYFPPTGPGIDINVEGIRLTVTAIVNASSPQTFTVTRSVDGYDKALNSGAKVRLWTPARYAL